MLWWHSFCFSCIWKQGLYHARVLNDIIFDFMTSLYFLISLIWSGDLIAFFAIKDGNGEFLSGCFLTVIFLSSIPFPVGTFTFLKVKRHQSLKFKPIFLKFSFKHQIKQTLTNFFVKKINTIKKSEGKKRKKLCFFTHSKNYFTQGCRATASSLTEIPNKQLWIHVNVMKMFQNYSYWNTFLKFLIVITDTNTMKWISTLRSSSFLINLVFALCTFSPLPLPLC